MPDFLQTVGDRVVIYDGAMGTNIQFHHPSVDDFWGKEGCNELLVLSRPEIIKDIHAEFFQVVCDVVETNTFGATRVVLAEHDLQDKVAKINIAAAKIAKEVAQQFSMKDKPRFVAGSIGPTTKLRIFCKRKLRSASIETQRLFEAGEYTKYLYLHGLSVETAESR